MKRQWEKALLEYYLNNYNAKWIRVFHNKHPVLATKVIFYTKFKRLLKAMMSHHIEKGKRN